MSENIVGTKQAAEILGVSISTIYRMVEQGILLPSKTPGGQRRFPVSQLEEYKEKSRTIIAPQNPYQMKPDTDSEVFVEDIRDQSSRVNSEDDENSESVVDDKPVDPRNTLNDLNGSQWLPETKSFFYQKGLGAKHPHAQIERQHPAPFSFQDISHLITFFTKKGMMVLDPFGGVGSTAKACELEGRVCTSIELQEKWHDLAIERLETEVGEDDLANIKNYEEFLRILVDDVFLECGRILRPKKYMCLIVSDFRNKSEFISFHSDLIQALNKRTTSDGYKITLQGVKVLLQNHKTLLPYGYPFAYVENIHHQYILIFRKDKK